MTTVLMVAGLGESVISLRGDLIKTWLAMGCRVVVAAPRFEHWQKLREFGCSYREIPLKRAGLNPLLDMLLFFYLIRLIRNEKPDCLFLYMIKPVIYASLAAYFYKPTKVFAMITGLGYVFSDTERKLLLREVVQLLYRLALKRCEKVIFQNPNDQSYFIDNSIIGPQKAALVNGSGVNLNRYNVAPLPTGGRATFLLIARLLKEKGISEYIEAARFLKSKYASARFVMIGTTQGRNPLSIRAGLIEQWRSENIVEILDAVEDVRSYIAEASVFVLPSYYREGIPRTVLEAMAMGRPVVTTDSPGCRETVTDGLNGYLVSVRDVGALVEAMERFIIEPGLIAVMGAASRKLAREKFDVHKINEKINLVIGLDMVNASGLFVKK